jgi:hypothetical protein
MCLTFYSRWNCPLCDEAWEWLHHDLGIEAQWRDIAADPVLEQRYGWSVPVLSLADGREFAVADPQQRRAAQAALRERGQPAGHAEGCTRH